MNDQFESEIADLIVAKLRNSPAIVIAMARVSGLDLAHFDSQPDSPRLIQRFLRFNRLRFVFTETGYGRKMDQNALSQRDSLKVVNSYLIDSLFRFFEFCNSD